VSAVTLPQTDQTICEVKDYGARANGIGSIRTRIQAVIDVCAMNGGGRVVFEEGTYRSGTIYLKSNIEFN